VPDGVHLDGVLVLVDAIDDPVGAATSRELSSGNV